MKQDHGELVHGRAIPQRRCLAVKQHGPRRLLSRPCAQLVAHGRPVRCGRVILLRSLHIKLVCLFIVDREPELTGAIHVGEKELRLGVRFRARRGEPLDMLERFRQERIPVLFPTPAIPCACHVVADDPRGLDQVLCKRELRLRVGIRLHAGAIVIHEFPRVRRLGDVDRSGVALPPCIPRSDIRRIGPFEGHERGRRGSRAEKVR